MGVIPTITERLLREPKSLTPQQRKNARYNLKNRVRRSVELLKRAATSNDEKTRRFAEEEIRRELCSLVAGTDTGSPGNADQLDDVSERYEETDSEDGTSSFEDDLWSGKAEL